MRNWQYLASTLLASAIAVPAHAEAEVQANEAETAGQEAPAAAAPAGRAFNTGVAKGRDLLNTAISASVIDEDALHQISATSVVGIMQNIPGMRAETSDVDGFSAITVRGLPLAADGSKFLQLQEDGLPVLEFGDIHFASADQFLRADLSLSQIQAIRGGSASTFASNAPGGVVNFISKTGETEGGVLQLSSGIGYDLNRADFSYGSPLGDGWRFHVGGFYRVGEGPRESGYNAFNGGQVKLNVTKELGNGYIRLYAKYLDDSQPNYSVYPTLLTGTNDAPVINNLPGNNAQNHAYQSSLTSVFAGVGSDNNPTVIDSTDGLRGIVKSIGLEGQFEIAGWTVTDRFRFSDVGGAYNETIPMISAPAGTLGLILGGPGATLSYAGGPNAGQTLNAATLAAITINVNAELNNLDNVTNDLRATRTWDVGGGRLTTTGGVYMSSQMIEMYWNFLNTLNDLSGGGRNAPLDLHSAGGVPLSDAGVYAYGIGLGGNVAGYHNYYDVGYDILAPYGSLNYQIGKLAVGASLRFDSGNVQGSVLSGSFGNGRTSVVSMDVNGDGQISAAENQVAILPVGRPALVDYDYNYLSYSASANYRLADTFSLFARYSRGARASAERILESGTLDPDTGLLLDPSVAFSPVKQAEAGIKYRTDGLAAYVTGFWASTAESNYQIGADNTGQVVVIPINRTYSAKGIELEAEYVRGPFSLALGGTWTDASINKDLANPALEGNRPRHIPSFSFQARPAVRFDLVSFGAVVNGTTGSFAQDSNILKQAGYVLVSPFLQVRPADHIELALNVFNVFDETPIVQIAAPVIPAGGLANVQLMNGRTVSASVRFTF